jgi:three-Cys-motif partner protein
MSDTFFEETTEQSAIKAKIVSSYFWAWSKVIIPSAKRHGDRIGYIDLFAGPGRYADGTKSTPLLVLEKAIADPDMRRMLVTLFNDADPTNVASLEKEIASLPRIEKLEHKPVVRNEIVDSELARFFQGTQVIPSFFFTDPWGYKGLSLTLINSVLKDWGCDCVFFFNYNRINMGVTNDAVTPHLEALFGAARVQALREHLPGLSPGERESVIVENLAQALRDKGAAFVLPFGFKNAQGSRTSHHLVFVTKHQKGYQIMKDIMARESSSSEEGVPSLDYNPTPADPQCKLLFALARPLNDLEGMLLEAFAGQTLTAGEIFERHNVGTRFIERNYKDVLRKIEAKNIIRAIPAAADRPSRKGEVTFANHVRVTFPKRKPLK